MSNAIATIEPTAVYEMLSEGAPIRLVDVRSSAEFYFNHAAGADSIPLREIESGRAVAELLGERRSLYLICASGARAERAARRLQAAGGFNLALVEGGTRGWSRRGLPTRSLARNIPLERQWQIAVGAVLLLVLAKGTLLHPMFLGLAGVVGLALIANGLSARLDLARWLTRLPWNRRPRRAPVTPRWSVGGSVSGG